MPSRAEELMSLSAVSKDNVAEEKETVDASTLSDAFSVSSSLHTNEDGTFDAPSKNNIDSVSLQMQKKTIHNLEMERDALKSELEHQVNRAKYFETRAISYRDALINLCNEIGGNN